MVGIHKRSLDFDQCSFMCGTFLIATKIKTPMKTLNLDTINLIYFTPSF
jgi:hypothetical protein